MRVAGRTITEICKLTVKEARVIFRGRLQLSAKRKPKVADKILEEIRSRLQFLDEVGLDYLSLDRLTSTLSGGESQRIQLATSLGSHLVGALYVLDEPSIGLHPRDTQTADRHSEIAARSWAIRCWSWSTIRTPFDAADYVIDLGPGAGELGGKLLFAGTYEEMLEGAEVDYRTLSERRVAHSRAQHRGTSRAGNFCRLYGAHAAQSAKCGR